jgi:3',5'-cyclic AMP phosphodiesterase CpdA
MTTYGKCPACSREVSGPRGGCLALFIARDPSYAWEGLDEDSDHDTGPFVVVTLLDVLVVGTYRSRADWESPPADALGLVDESQLPDIGAAVAAVRAATATL